MKGTRGFTLLEIVVAIAILATSLVVLLENVSSSIRLSGIARDRAVAAMLAQGKMTELELEAQYKYGEQQGDFEDRFPGFFWQVQTQDGMFPETLQIDLTILWGDPEAPERLTITNFVTGEAEPAPVEETTEDSGGEGTGAGTPSGGTTGKPASGAGATQL